jgi:hypothetical protein
MSKRKFAAGAVAVAAISLFSASGLFASSVTVSVPGTANPFLAGVASGSCCNGDTVPGESPSSAGAVTVGATLTFTAVTGGVSYAGGSPTDGPDGNSGNLISTPDYEGGLTTINNIAGYYHAPVDALVGVFLGPNDPTTNPAPALLDFGPGALGTNFGGLTPTLQQIFFIGDGLTGTGSGGVQKFIVPTGATRLYLGVVDGFGWFNNSGSISVTVNSNAAVTPEPAEMSLVLIGLGAVGFAYREARRR